MQEDGGKLLPVVPGHRTMGQWAQTGTKDVPFEHEEKLLSCDGDRALQQATQRGGGDSLSGEIQSPPGHDPVQLLQQQGWTRQSPEILFDSCLSLILSITALPAPESPHHPGKE